MRLHLGQVVATPAALELLERHGTNPLELLRRHGQGDWGQVGDEDWRANDAAMASGARILSSYELGRERVWVITEAADDRGARAATTLLLPEEY